jgi:SAM-dependent methyltransferase
VNLPFASVAEVLDGYVFDALPEKLGLDSSNVEPGLVDYLGTHWQRFLTTLEILRGLSPKRMLDVGVFPPLVFEALMANLWPGVKMAGLWEGPEPWSQHVKSRSDRLADFEMTLSPANSERDRWPFETGAFDLVLGMEILEHLALDPYFFFSEAARVLEPGGHILITTPNVTSHRGVWKVLNQLAPYSFGIFVPTGGVYGRHNREYAPEEVELLGSAAGFETQRLFTADVYDDAIDPGTAELLIGRGDTLSLRGETIFYLGRKTGEPTGAPGRLYHGDPVRMSGELRLEKTETDTGLAQLVAVNTSKAWWPVEGQGATCFLAQWIDATGTLVHQVVLELLTEPVAPGAEQGIRLRLDPDQAGKPDGHLKLHLFQAGVGPFSGTGRASALTVPCSQEAFLRLASRAYG